MAMARAKAKAARAARKQPDDDRVHGVIEAMIQRYGSFNQVMDEAHIQLAASKEKYITTFGEDFWERVIAALHQRRRNGGHS